MMKFFTLFMTIFTLMISEQALAHTDHALGEGNLHFAYHLVFWGLIIFAGYKAVAYFKAKQ